MSEQSSPKRLGRYEIVAELGKGAMGVVYEGRDPRIGRRVAIKTARRDVLAASGMADEMMARFQREARAAGALNHPSIITIYDVGEEDGIAYIAMEYIEGGDLRGLLARRPPPEPEKAVEIGATLAEALAAAHDQGIVHRDIKPANIMTPLRGPVKLADFGIAHVSDSNLTQEGALIGTPHYMSPEQFMGQKVDGRADLFSLANILYELLTGEKPFTGEALSTVMHHVIKTDPVPPQELNYNVPDALAQVIMKALSKRPAQRYPNGRAMAAALRESLKENPDPAILEGRSPEVDATVVAPPVEDATMAGAPPALEQAAGAGTAAAAPAGTATVPGSPPPQMGAASGMDLDKPLGPPPGALGQDPRLRVAGVAVAIAVLLMLIVGIAWLLGGNDEATAGPQATLRFDVWRALDQDTYAEWVERESYADAGTYFRELTSGGRLLPAHGAQVSVTRGATNQLLGEEEANEFGRVDIQIPDSHEEVSVEARLEGHDPEGPTTLRKQGDIWRTHHIVLRPEG